MNILAKIIEFLDAKMETPTAYGAFHLAFFISAIVLGIVLARLNKNGSENFTRALLLTVGVTVIILEVYKQIIMSVSVDGGAITWDYAWYIFPLQFCSTPMFVSLIAALVKNKTLHNSLCAYLATFSTFAGLAVMVYPGDVFIPTIGINIQTMICHGSMITVGIYLFATGYVRSEHKTMLKAIPVFAFFVALAAAANEIAYFSGLLETDTFNMFYISPHCDPHLPVYSIVQEHVPFPFCLIIYIIGFSAAAYIMLLISMAIHRIAASRKENKEAGERELVGSMAK